MNFRQELRELVNKYIAPTSTPRDYLDIADDLLNEAYRVDKEANRTLDREINGCFRTARQRS